ncbi:MAG: DUF885 domain-containing protein [Acidimicrobiia bacterium]|nr:DUF885 domain-containing protein [Acidimicrobiia bacterium]
MTSSPLAVMIEDAFEALWALQPAWAVYLGKHEYDGLVPDWSADAVADVLSRLDALRSDLEVVGDLTADDAIDRDLLAAQIDKTRFEWTNLRIAHRNPMPWIYHLDPDLYLRRSYADDATRAAATVRLLSAAGPLLATARIELDEDLDRTICEWGITAAEGLAEMIRGDVVEAFQLADDGELRSAAEAAADELVAFARWLESDRLSSAGERFAIGADAMEELLRHSESIAMSLDELLAVGQADLERNLDAFRQTADEIDPGADPRAVYEEHVASVHAARGGLIPQTEAMLESIRAYLLEHDLITIPSEVRAKVAETPKHLRWAFAMMDTPGPYETAATDAYYFVTPDEPEWDDARAEEWLRTLNTFALEDISIHEAYPGHYVHFLHYASAPTEVARRLTSYAFTEGWAHYAEQMMWEAGYRSGDPRFRLAQLSEALVRNCRFVCAIRLHAHGMTVDEATQFFIDNAFYHEMPARKEAERGTFDPGYFSYTLGKLQILQLRDDCRKAWGEQFSLRRFHDQLLSRGAPPVETMRRVLLG